MRLDAMGPEMRSLLEEPSPATLTLHDEDGEVVASPVWFLSSGDAFEVVVAATDQKLAHLQRDPHCALLIFEAHRPFRGLLVSAVAARAWDLGDKLP